MPGTQTHTDRVTALELVERTGHFAYEQDDGQMGFGPINARTLFFDAVSDDEAMYAHAQAAPDGRDSVQMAHFTRTLQRDL